MSHSKYVAAGALLLACGAALNAAVSGPEVYQKYCASCHDQSSPRIPPKAALQKLSSARILRTLDFGLMMSIAYPLKREERAAVAGFLGIAGAEAGPPASAFCSSDKHPMAAAARANWNGWSPTVGNTRYQSTAQAGIAIGQVRSLKLKWAYGFAGDVTAFAAPTVLNGTIFVGSAAGTIQALDARSGCVHWVFQANGPVRSAILAVPSGGRTTLLFGDQIGSVYSLDAMTGKQLWRKRVEEHEATRLTGAPVTQDGVVFIPASSWEETRSIDPQYACCTFRGSVTALRVSDGGLVWKAHLVGPPVKTGVTSIGTPQYGPSGAGVWSAPTIDTKRGVMYVATGDNYSQPATTTSDAVVALELKTGRIVWSQQTLPGDAYNSACSRGGGPNCPTDSGPDYDYGSSALMVRMPDGRDMLVAGQKSGMVYALDPDQKGKIVWQARVGKGGLNGGVQWGMASDGQKVYASVGDAVRQGAIVSAAPVGNVDFDQTQGGGLTALRVADGTQVWHTPGHACDPPKPGCSPAQSGAVTAIPGVIFSGSLDGHVRGYSTEDGQVLWDFDTARDYTTVNGVPAKGGSLDGAGPVIVGGMMYVNSGYPRNGGMPGNVLLAFGPEN